METTADESTVFITESTIVTTTETETAEEEVTEPIPLSKATTSDGIELDPDVTSPAPDQGSITVTTPGKAYLLKKIDDYTAIYGVISNEEKYAGFDQTVYTEKIAVQHNGIVDEMECEWTSRSGEKPRILEPLDADLDETDEIVMINYTMGGTMCYVDDLTVFDEKDGHYYACKAWYDENKKVFGNSYTYSIDSAQEKITVTTDSGDHYLDYGYTISGYEDDPDIYELIPLDIIHFDIENDRLTGCFTVGGIAKDQTGNPVTLPVTYIDVDFDVEYDGEKITFGNYRIEGYDYILEQTRSADMGADYTLTAHDRKSDEYIEIISGSAFLPKDTNDLDRYVDLSIRSDDLSVMGYDCACLSHSVVNLMHFDYYTIIDGKPVMIAENYGSNIYDGVYEESVWSAPKAMSYDIDGDGKEEFISGCMSGGDGVHSIFIYKMEDGKPYVANLADNITIDGEYCGLASVPDISFKDDNMYMYDTGETCFIVRYSSKVDGEYRTTEYEIKLSDIKADDLDFKEYVPLF